MGYQRAVSGLSVGYQWVISQLPEAGRAGRFSSASARNRGGGLLAPPPRVQAREAQKLRSDFFLVRISKSNLWGKGGRNRERGEEDGSLHPSLHPTLRKGELLSLSAERGTSHFSNFWEGRWKALQCRLLFRTPAEGVPLEVQRDRLAGSFSLFRRNRNPAATTHSPGGCENS